MFVFNLNLGEDNDAFSPVSNWNLGLETEIQSNSKRRVLVNYYFKKKRIIISWKVFCVACWEMFFEVFGLQNSYRY